MSTGLDTSVVLRLLVGEPADQSAAAWRHIAEQASSPAGPAAVSDLVVGESYFALRHHYAVPHQNALQALESLLADQRIHTTGVAGVVIAAARSVRTGPGFLDRLIHADYANDGADLVTFDRGASALPLASLLAG